MTEEQQASFDKWLEDLSRDAPPFVPRAGGQSLFAGFAEFIGIETREQKLARPIRSHTLDWLAWELAIAGQRSFQEARLALVEAIPVGDEDLLDEEMGYLVPFDLAAFALKIDPYAISLRPERLHS